MRYSLLAILLVNCGGFDYAPRRQTTLLLNSNAAWKVENLPVGVRYEKSVEKQVLAAITRINEETGLQLLRLDPQGPINVVQNKNVGRGLCRPTVTERGWITSAEVFLPKDGSLRSDWMNALATHELLHALGFTHFSEDACKQDKYLMCPIVDGESALSTDVFDLAQEMYGR